MRATPGLQCGGYVLVLRCPDCLEAHEAFIILDTRHTSDANGGSLRPVLHAKAVDHLCGQTNAVDQVDVVDADTDQVGTRPFDFRERAAGER